MKLDLDALARISHIKTGRFTDLVRASGLDPAKDFRGLNLDGITIQSDEDLSGYDFSGSTLRGAILRGVDLRRTILTGADISGADLREALIHKTGIAVATRTDKEDEALPDRAHDAFEDSALAGEGPTILGNPGLAEEAAQAALEAAPVTTAAEIARKALSRGDLIGAYDATVAAMEAGDDSGAIRHQQILALARMGDTDRAMEKFAAYGLEGSSNVDERTIGARILKDRAFNTPAGPERQAAMERAFEAYHDVYEATKDSFPGINAATLALLAGRDADSRALAEALLADPEVAAPADYYKAATQAEALLLLGRSDEVTEVLAGEVIRSSTDLGGRSSTLRQLGMIGAHLGMSPHERATLVAPLRPPRVLHYCGHMFGADGADEARIRAAVDAVLDEEEVGFAYGALACGADIIAAEALLARGVELNVVMPFEEQDFLEQSVRPGGPGWEARYRTCLRGAKRVVHASPMAYFGNPDQYGYSSRMAMGLTCLRAEHLAAEPIQLAIWDGVAPDGPAGTGADVLAWQGAGGRTRSVDPGAVTRGLERPPPRIVTTAERALAAILFTDFAGFSKLSETVLPAFWDGVMRIIAEVLDAHGEVVVSRNTWGDALYGVISSAPAAAEISLQIQDALDDFDYSALGLDGKGGRMRIGAHYGPAYRAIDHITGRLNFYGNEVSKAARIEPVTPTGAVFVTEPFAAILALEAPDRFDCRYVGRIQLAKGYGSYPMYRLTRAD